MTKFYKCANPVAQILVGLMGGIFIASCATTSVIPPSPPYEIDVLDRKISEGRSDSEVQYLYRAVAILPPKFSQGKYSGYCDLIYDVTQNGDIVDVEVYYCTDERLVSSSEAATEKWQAKSSNYVHRGVKARMHYGLLDSKGARLPLPPSLK